VPTVLPVFSDVPDSRRASHENRNPPAADFPLYIASGIILI
jgi:hypothetical protein